MVRGPLRAVWYSFPGRGAARDPPALRYFPLDDLRAALKTGTARDYLCAGIAALTGPLRHLLRRPYLARPREDDVTYQARKAPTSPSRHLVTVHTLDGLHIEDVSFPRPWGTPTTTGYFTGQSDTGREDLARAILAHALGGTAPTSRASCGSCHGNGWLTALDPEHNAHVPAYRPDGRHVCSCGGCRGTGLRPLPVQLFAATFLPGSTPAPDRGSPAARSWNGPPRTRPRSPPPEAGAPKAPRTPMCGKSSLP